MKAIWQGQVIADSDATIVIEGNHYFPPDSVRRELLSASDTHSYCPWKGQASYHHVQIGDNKNPDAAWYYPEPKAEAAAIKDYLAFWHGVEIVE